MRGVTVEDDDGKTGRWCPLVYEYLPDFCYICGIIGHTEGVCSVRLQEGEAPQYNKSLRFIPMRGRSDGEVRRMDVGRSLGWKPNPNVSHGRSEGGVGWVVEIRWIP